MTAFQSKWSDQSKRLGLSGLLAFGFITAVSPIGTTAAQEKQPLDLLSIRQVNDVANSPATSSSEVTLDTALDQVIAKPDMTPSPPAVVVPGSAADTSDDTPTPPATPPATADTGTAAPSITPTVDPAPGVTVPRVSLGSSSAYGSAKIGRRDISDVGLAAIGVGDDLGSTDTLDSLIWRGTSARDAVFLLEKAAVDSRSQAITRLAYRVVSRQSVPPAGANIVAADLVAARLAFLANGGRSGDLARLAEQLPDGDKWQDWRRWLVEHHLMMRNDKAGCEVVARQITQTMDSFWHKANVVCQAVQGNLGAARFAADVLAANGIEDQMFFSLVKEVLNAGAPQPIDASKLNSLHIVLMDVANRPIPLEGLAVLPRQMAETVVKLKFLGPDARMVSTFDGLNRGLISARQAGKLWRNAGTETTDPALALAQLDVNADPLTTALAWRALAAEASAQRLGGVAKAVRAEILAGNGAIMVPLYAELVREALTDEAVAAQMKFDDLGLAPRLAMLLAISSPEDDTTLESFAGNSEALLAAGLLRSLSGEPVSNTALDTLDLWHLLPVLMASGATIETQNWLELTKTVKAGTRSLVALSPVLLEAVKKAAADRRVAETVLLVNWLLQDVALAEISPADAAIVIAALQQIGQEVTAKALAQEILAAHLMRRLALMIPNGTQS